MTGVTCGEMLEHNRDTSRAFANAAEPRTKSL